MMLDAPTRIEQLFTWCQRSYLRHNIRIQFPKDTDPKKTYQWRYLSSLSEKFQKWEFSDELAAKFIEISVDYSCKRGLGRKGLSIFHQSNLMEICYNKLIQEAKVEEDDLGLLKSTHEWLKAQANKQPVEYLLRRDNQRSYCNLTKWFLARRIPTIYLAMSTLCKVTLDKLQVQDNIERQLLPAAANLYLLFSKSPLRQANLDFLKTW